MSEGKFIAVDPVTGSIPDPRMFDTRNEASRAVAQTGSPRVRIVRVVDETTYSAYERFLELGRQLFTANAPVDRRIG